MGCLNILEVHRSIHINLSAHETSAIPPSMESEVSGQVFVL